jgi:hypothetical protein
MARQMIQQPRRRIGTGFETLIEPLFFTITRILTLSISSVIIEMVFFVWKAKRASIKPKSSGGCKNFCIGLADNELFSEKMTV